MHPISPEPMMPVDADDADIDANLRGLVFTAYGLLVAACFTGVTALIAVIIAYMKWGDAAGTPWRSHFHNVIVVFWVLIAVFAVGFLIWPFALGLFMVKLFAWPAIPALALPLAFWFLLFPAIGIWFLYRIIRGLLHASENRSY